MDWSWFIKTRGNEALYNLDNIQNTWKKEEKGDPGTVHF